MNSEDFKQMVESAIDKLEAQGEPAKNAQGGCFYSGLNGHCCIVGHMMTEDQRQEADNSPNTRIDELHGEGFEWTQQFTAQQLDTLDDLQINHDSIPLKDKHIFKDHIDAMRKIAEALPS